MKCEICHQNDAEQPIVKTENGVQTELYVCKSCAAQLKVGQIGKYSLADVLFDFSSAKQEEVATVPETEQVCPMCGMTFAKIHATRRVGCPHCYTFFENQLERMVALFGLTDIDLIVKDVSDLKQKLEVAIAEERFEEAAVIRDLINSKTESNNLNPFAGKENKMPMPPELLDVMKKMGIDIDDISDNRDPAGDDPFDSEDDSSSDNDPF